mmetsp:Transcript_44129/g.42817  ORF Transcript_44129/g.42817 Transcript_44129/m.42817 type:complete len:212 (-) Transcript_44129:2533-3168(-)
MQFHIHKILQKFWKYSSLVSQNWKAYLSELPQADLDQIYEILFESSFQINEESATLCLAIAALGLIPSSEAPMVKLAFELGLSETNFNVFHLIKEGDQKEEKVLAPQSVDVEKLVSISLLGKNKNHQRAMAAYLCKGLYRSEKSLRKAHLFNFMISKIPDLKNFGINTSEFLSVLSSIVKEELHLKDSMVSGQQVEFVTAKIQECICEMNT